VITGTGDGCILQRHRFAVPSEAGAKVIQQGIEAGVRELLRSFQPERIGVGFGGPLDRATARVARSHQVEGWSGFDLNAWLSELARCPVVADNDTNMAALGEARLGAGRGSERVFYVTLGSGVGGGLVIGGKVFHGAAPGESEIGHLRLNREGWIVEEHCSGWAVDRRIRDCIRREPESCLARLAADSPGREARHLAAALHEGDPQARVILEETAGDLAFALSHVTHLMHPDCIVLGGGLSLVGEPLRAAVAAALPGFLMEVFRPGPDVRLSVLGEDAVPVGCLLACGTGGREL
jgi:glucokinase